jgi:diadenosine tetraphosphate (Ap4A) HIT family hydrolase
MRFRGALKMKCCSVERFTRDENKIAETEHWALYVRDPQVTLGSCVVALKRHCPTLGEMTTEETADFAKMTKLTESALRKAFGFEQINWLALMMVDHHVHFHVIPRYSEQKEFAGITWIDQDWPVAIDVKKSVKAEAVVLGRIQDAIKKALK